MQRLTYCLLLVLLVVCLSSNSDANVVVSMVGDVDGFSPGDPDDAPFRSQDVLDALTNVGYVPPIDLDQPLINQGMGFTHSFDLPPGQTILGATLTVGQHPSPGTVVETDFLALDVNVNGSIQWGSGFGPRAVFADQLGFVPPASITTEVVWDLSTVPMRSSQDAAPTTWNLLPQLVDGEFNVIAADDSGIDYSILEIVTIPEPSTVLLLTAATYSALRRRR